MQTQDVPLFPNIEEAVREFEAMVVWKIDPSGERLPEPAKGVCADYDSLKARASSIVKQLEAYLE